MQIRITKAFRDDSSPRPLLVNELVDVSDAVAEQWIAEGKAQAFAPAARPVVNAVPPRRQRERAVRVR